MKKIISILLAVLVLVTVLTGCSDIVTVPSVIISDEVQQLAEDTIEAVEQGEDIESDDLADKVNEDQIEPDAVIEQENISYDGTATGEGVKLLGSCSGLTYYSQADSRWATMPYTSTGDKSQTMKSSACGPTSAAMVVSSSKGAILPTTMAQLFVDNGYRTRSNGTAWSCWAFVADYFGFNEYHTTASVSTAFSYLRQDKNADGASDYFVVASCGSGLFTSGGHYITIVGDKDGTLTVYDPYLYLGKFDTASRKAAGVKVNGTTAYVTEQAFSKYANTKQFWIFSNDYQAPKPKPITTKTTTKPTTTKKQTTTAKPVVKYKTTIGKKYRLKQKTVLYSKSNLTGTKYTYLKQTEVKVIKHISANVDYVLCTKTGRKAYCKVTNYA